MGDGSALDDLQRKQGEAAKLAMRMTEEKDPEKLAEMAKAVLEQTKDLERMARNIGAAALGGLPVGGKETRVVLTPEQKERLVEQTGVGLDAVVLEDEPTRKWSKDIATARPHEVERMAARATAAIRLQTETKKAIEGVIQQLEALEVPELKETIDELRAHPALKATSGGARGKT
jgi:hypothetical protein